MKRDIKYIITVSAIMLILQGCGGTSVTDTDKPAENTLQIDGALKIPSGEKEEKIDISAKAETAQSDKETNSEFVIAKDNETIDIQNDQTKSHDNDIPEGIVVPQKDEEIELD